MNTEPNVSITQAESKDVFGIAELHTMHSGGNFETRAAAVRIELGRPDRRLLVAHDRTGAVAGYGRITTHIPGDGETGAPGGFYLGGLVVHPDHRHRGLGRALTVARMNAIFSAVDSVWYFTDVDNLASIALHHKLGFCEVTRNFSFPGVTFATGGGILFHAARG